MNTQAYERMDRCSRLQWSTPKGVWRGVRVPCACPRSPCCDPVGASARRPERGGWWSHDGVSRPPARVRATRCRVLPEQTEGPYHRQAPPERVDITEDCE